MKEIFAYLNIPVYIVMFLVLYYQVFLLISFFDSFANRKKAEETLKQYNRDSADAPTVTIFVPCYNEEETIIPTIESLLLSNYPKDKLDILVVDDGSKDSTYTLVTNYIETHPEHKNLRVVTKPNGGKHSALNLGLSMTNSEIVGCLDADSFADSEAIAELVKHFADPKVVAVTPSMKVWNPRNVLQQIQKVEYDVGIFLRAALSFINGIYVTPGPLSVFRKSLFDEIGGYRKAHNAEDLEMALRIQYNGKRIANSTKAFVYTVTPDNIPTLIKQRVRWSQGFLRNSYDYRSMVLNPKRGNLGIIVLPMSILMVFFSIYAFFIMIASLIWSLIENVMEFYFSGGFHLVPFSFTNIKWTWFAISASWIVFILYAATAISLVVTLLGRKMSNGKYNIFSKDLWLFTFIYGFIAPLWLIKTVFEIITKKQNKWK